MWIIIILYYCKIIFEQDERVNQYGIKNDKSSIKTCTYVTNTGSSMKEGIIV